MLIEEVAAGRKSHEWETRRGEIVLVDKFWILSSAISCHTIFPKIKITMILNTWLTFKIFL